MSSFPEQVEGVKFKSVDGGSNVRIGDNEELHFLNRTACAILLLCDGKTSEADIAETLKTSFGLSHPPLADVSEMLEEFRQAGLVRT